MPLINQAAYEGRTATETRAGVVKLSEVGGNVPQATTTLAGKAEIATQAEVNTGTDNTRIVTPLTLKTNLTTPPAIGGTTPNSGAFTTVSATSTITAGTTVTATTSITAGTTITATAGDITATLGHIIVNGAAKQFRCHGGAATDFIGTATLVNGVATVLNTNIATTDRIIVSRSAKNASTAYGTFQVVKTAATNFVITACKSDTTTETGDQSTVEYVIVRQV